MAKNRLRCLIIERHAWETGFQQEQLQFPLAIANAFFGSGKVRRNIRVRVLPFPGQPVLDCSISKVYSQSATRRLNSLPLVGDLPACFIFIQETREPNIYNFWWQHHELPVITARYSGWTQAKNSQHGRGRLANIVNSPVPRPINRI